MFKKILKAYFIGMIGFVVLIMAGAIILLNQ